MTLLMTGITEALAPLHNKIYRIITEKTKDTFLMLSHSQTDISI